jgi:hypothetical protein
MRRLHHGLHEILMLEGMQRVVMHENADGALCRQVMRGVIKHMAEMLAAVGLRFGVGMGMRGHGGGILPNKPQQTCRCHPFEKGYSSPEQRDPQLWGKFYPAEGMFWLA